MITAEFNKKHIYSPILRCYGRIYACGVFNRNLKCNHPMSVQFVISKDPKKADVNRKWGKKNEVKITHSETTSFKYRRKVGMLKFFNTSMCSRY